MTDLRKLNIDGTEYEVPADYTLMQACEEYGGAEIPRFCYHERLSVAGNCRMCLVEWVGAPKPQASCALQVKDMRPNRDGTPANIRTNTEVVKKAREGVMEFLLINHPLDCPICDQGGECDLQDQAMGYGRDATRFEENKRAVDDKHMGPLVNTVMTRCIQCTRCVRFITEVAGVQEIGLVNRGENAEITTYLEKSLTSEMSGNVIDLCPVGALTSKPYAFNARPWELDKVDSIDVMDAVGCNIRVDSRRDAVLRILPVTNDDVNEEWISDKTRFVWDGLARQRLDRPFIRKDGKLQPANWDEALAVVAEKLSADPSRIAAIAGDLCDAESMKALKDLMDSLGVRNIDCRQDGSLIGEGPRQSYLFNTTISGIEDADAILLIGTNPRHEAPLINTRIRKTWIDGNLEIGLIGEAADLTYTVDHVGTSAADVATFAKSKSGFAKTFKAAKNPVIIVGAAALRGEAGLALLEAIGQLAKSVNLVRDDFNGFNVLHSAASRVGGLDMGFIPGEGGLATDAILDAAQQGAIETVYLMGADELDTSKLKDAFVIYQGHHGDNGAHVADVILPGAAYTEKSGLYVNMEGRVQLSSRAVAPKGEAKEDWAIIRALSAKMNRVLPYDSLEALRVKLMDDCPSFLSIDSAPSLEAFDPTTLGKAGELSTDMLKNPIADFYMTNPIARASNVMAECSAVIAGLNPELNEAAE
ncbi:NADH-quinone oxidoreductase [Litorimonas cladophorae]|uniref:NADH-quinone oxidoreductase n=1 Tax=Litorimonas cladophorae TaxID=1220491 RepID=A0A918KBK4_9PROT|nr:NADH-quinone oxidoreductase subunit NuoG [Litorimonas cladophorae]GGX57528.1 NADH-quinone oxidoreductase [Litorimonas cladophorae]